MNLFFPIAGFCFGAATAILQTTPAEKRKKYAIRALAIFLGIFTGFAGVVLLDLLVAHFHRRKAFKQWKACRDCQIGILCRAA